MRQRLAGHLLQPASLFLKSVNVKKKCPPKYMAAASVPIACLQGGVVCGNKRIRGYMHENKGSRGQGDKGRWRYV